MGSDANSYLDILPKGGRFERLSPVNPTRLAMWACCLGMALNDQFVPGFRAAWTQAQISLELWEKAREDLDTELGHAPHAVQVAERCMKALQSASPPPLHPGPTP